ncbi:MAG: threonylcarbamoyl-AMP synthase [Spongiibacteraceae bacterium]|nr:threonylcarbamoyl-AMP synthase [Spongiibacteraceae bacterium]
MSQFFQIHPDNPQSRLIEHAVDIFRKGGVVVYPTDSGYALGCQLGNKKALETIRRIRKLDNKHNFTLMCRDLSELGTYARVENTAYRLIKVHTPGPYTFIFKATNEVPKRLMHPKRRTIGLRVPDNRIALALLEALNEPIMSVTMMLPGDDSPMMDPYEIRQTLEHDLDLVIDGGYCGMEATSVIDMVEDTPSIIRQGLGDTSAFVA